MKIMFWKNKITTNHLSAICFDHFTLTDTGIVRDHNEDSLSVIKNIDGNGGLLAIVADGMGGHAGGEVASKMAVDIISEYIKRSKQVNESSLKDAISFANKAIYDKAQNESKLKGMGTTCVVLYTSNYKLIWANVGDSRLYQNQEDNLIQISVDDVFQDDNSGKSHILTQACGTKPKVNVHTGQRNLTEEGLPSQFLLCSDGLYDLVKNNELRKVLNLGSLSFSAELLMGLAKERGGHDNISIILIEANSYTTEATTQEIKIRS
ncbi:MAG: serine/threonine-protein phosphatase [Saprospiraceae bacterium]|nr:serine/threonine-protein phosphatase [Saprospiraceae bacterium]